MNSLCGGTGTGSLINGKLFNEIDFFDLHKK